MNINGGVYFENITVRHFDVLVKNKIHNRCSEFKKGLV